MHFWDGNIPAPLKQIGETGSRERVPNFWDGNIPAPLKQRGAHGVDALRRHFWDGNIPAPLKRAGGGEGAGRPVISGMETSRPH